VKILYLTVCKQSIKSMDASQAGDAQSDYLMLGLRELLGDNLIDVYKKVHLYKGYPNQKKLSGRGFTYSCNLDDIPIDREDIPSKIVNKYFDLIILSQHWSTEFSPKLVSQWAEDILKTNPDQKLSIVLGQDSKPDYPEYFNYTNLVFRREIEDNFDKRLIPISFCLPDCKLVKNPIQKTRQFSKVLVAGGNWIKNNKPEDLVYLYESEKEYYGGYQESYFAFTSKKGNFDCHRHYEILGNFCIPIFVDIEACPERTLTFLPKKLLSDIKRWPGLNLSRYGDSLCYPGWDIIPNKSYMEDNFDYQLYDDMVNYLFEYTKKYLTTSALAKYFLKKVELC